MIWPRGVNTLSKVRKVVSAIQEVDSTRNIQLGFSSIVQRADKDYSKEIKDINTRLKSYCLGNGLIFVDNSNIDESCLSNSKLHLSKKGTPLLSQNILKSLEGHWNTYQQTIGNDIRNSHLSCSQDFSQELKNLRIENPANPIFAYLNINSIRNKFNDLQELIKGNIDVVMIAETKIDASLQQRNFYSTIIISLSGWI